MGSNPISSTKTTKIVELSVLSSTVVPHVFRPLFNSLFDHQASAIKEKSSHSRFSRGTVTVVQRGRAPLSPIAVESRVTEALSHSTPRLRQDKAWLSDTATEDLR